MHFSNLIDFFKKDQPEDIMPQFEVIDAEYRVISEEIISAPEFANEGA